MKVAMYVRVSTQRQAQTQTIEQQLDRLREQSRSQGWSWCEEHIFRDDGYSGASLRRPGLDRLRDQVRAGAFDRVIITAPDRLARNYVHQVLLMEELERGGCHVEFVDHPMSQDPHDQLLLQIHGAVAEYERSLIAERMRRGRQQKYQAGGLLPWTHPPYGYRVDPARPRDPAGARLEPDEAAVVAEIFATYAQEKQSLMGITKQLMERRVPTPSGRWRWNQATVHGIVSNPIYTGTVYIGRTRATEAHQRHSALAPIGRVRGGHTRTDPAEWVAVAQVPAIVSQELFDQVQAKLAQNQQFASRNNTAHPYLLRALVSCGVCHLSCMGRSSHPGYAYYTCRGKNQMIVSCRDEKCHSRFIPAGQLDELVWQDVCEVLTHPATIAAALQRAQGGQWLPQELQARRENLRKARVSLEHQMERLTDAYLANVLQLGEYKRRHQELEQRLQAIAEQVRQLEASVGRHDELAAMVQSIDAFCQRVQQGLAEATFEQKRQLIELLVDRVVVTGEEVEIRYVIPTSPSSEQIRFCHLRSDYFFTGQATKEPVLLIIEDIHWSDETSLEFLHYLARRCADHPLLVLLTYRSDEVRPDLRHFLAQLDRERLAHEISLARLTRDEVDGMLRAIFALPRSVRLELPDPLYALTEGNPFYVEEILKSLITAGDIFYENGRWERKALSELHIPRSVQDAVQQRTDQLSEPARHILTLAAVAGRRFDFALLQELTHHDEQHLLQHIKELMAAQLVVEESAEQFAFRHALTRQAIYADLLVRERKALHRSIADKMERLYSAVLEMHLADLAYHFYEAGAWEKALGYAQRAGEQAQAMYAPRAAIEQFTRALDAAQRGSIPPPAVLYRLRGQAYETLGDFERACLDYETTLELARVAGDLHGEWQALMDLGFLWAQRDYAQAGTHYQQALELARRMDDPLTLAHSLNRLGNWRVNIEQPREALHYHQEALTVFQGAHDSQGIAQTYDLLGMANTLGGDLYQATAYYQRAVALLQELDDRQGLTSSLATLMCLGGEYETETMVPAPTSFAECLHLGERALKIAREIDQRSAEIYALCALGQCLGPRGEYVRALKLAQEGLALAEQIEHHEWMTHGHWVLGALYLDVLALPEAQQHLEQALALAQEVGSWNWMRIVSGFLAPVLILQQDLTQAEQAFATAGTIIEELAANVPDEPVREQFLRQATAMLPHVRSLSPDRAAKQTFGGLTAREREVAALIAQGKINREIAEDLVVSERTVESHVANIMFKLGVHSRRQIRA